jgi:hypothetical protein
MTGIRSIHYAQVIIVCSMSIIVTSLLLYDEKYHIKKYFFAKAPSCSLTHHVQPSDIYKGFSSMHQSETKQA